MFAATRTDWWNALQDMEDQTTGDRAGFSEPNLDLLCQAKRKAATASGQRLLPFIVLPVIIR